MIIKILTKKYVIDGLLTIAAFIISHFLYNLVSQPIEEYEDLKKLPWLIYEIKIFSMIALVVVPIREYFQWTFREEIQGWKPVVCWFMIFILTIIFTTVPIISLIIPEINEFIKRNDSFILLNIFALTALSFSDVLVRNKLKKSPSEWQLKINTNEFSIKDNSSLTQQEKNKLFDENIKLNKKIQDYPITLSFYENIITYADLCIIISLFFTYIFYITFPCFFNLDVNERYEIFFDGATTFQVIISTVIYFTISIKYEKRI